MVGASSARCFVMAVLMNLERFFDTLSTSLSMDRGSRMLMGMLGAFIQPTSRGSIASQPTPERSRSKHRGFEHECLSVGVSSNSSS